MSAPAWPRPWAIYLTADRREGSLQRQLEVVDDATVRGYVLFLLAGVATTQADVYCEAFDAGDTPDPDDNPDAMAASLADRAILLKMLSRVEYGVAAIANGADPLPRKHLPAVERHLGIPESSRNFVLILAAEPVLKRMLVTPDLDDRCLLLADLYDAVYPIVGGDAAETVACVRAPGRHGWRETDWAEVHAAAIALAEPPRPLDPARAFVKRCQPWLAWLLSILVGLIVFGLMDYHAATVWDRIGAVGACVLAGWLVRVKVEQFAAKARR